MFAHPHCPCTRASLGELNAVMAMCGSKVEIYIFFTKPSGFSDSWVKSDLWRSAASLPGVHVIQDDEGKTAEVFHATTSGQVLLYDKGGALIFNGGITGSRGHAGDNQGRQSVISLLLGEPVRKHRTSVYGCSLFAKEVLSS